MIMKNFIPNTSDPPDSDDSFDEIVPVIGVQDQDLNDDEDIESDSGSEEDSSMLEVGDVDIEDKEIDSDSSEFNTDDTDSDPSEDEEDTTLQEIFNVKPNKESTRDIPPTIEANVGISDICFHPEKDIIAAATLGGDVIFYRYSEDSTEEEARFTHHKKSCRAVCFADDGKSMFTISGDKSLALVDVENSAVKLHIKKAHEAALYSFCPIDEALCATGDDDGVVKIWDFRNKKAVFEFKTGEHTISSLIVDSKKKTLAATVNDGSLAGFNIRGKKLIAQSELYKSELTSCTLIKQESRLVVGSAHGEFYFYNWGEFGYHLEKFKGHPEEIYCLASITDKLVLSGSEDGVIRATHFYPHRFIGIVGQHKGASVDNMSTSSDGKLLASCGMDETIRFWNIDYLYDFHSTGRKGVKRLDLAKNLPSSRERNSKEFFDDFPDSVESDDEKGPVCGPSNVE